MKIKDLKLTINMNQLDSTIEKMNRLKQLLEEVNKIISSLDKINIEVKTASES